MPKENVQTATEVESWTVNWRVKTGWSGDTESRSKVFINYDEAEEFERQLKKQAKFIGCWISTSLYRN